MKMMKNVQLMALALGLLSGAANAATGASKELALSPVLVRLSSAIEGFDYADFAAPDTGADMIFTDMDGVARYPYEIDEWHQDGESLVWVKLPQMANGTKFKMAYGGGRGATALPGGNGRAASPLAAAVWSDYAGVWHMNEDSGTAYDSTAHGLDALPSCGVNGDVSQMVAYENGAYVAEGEIVPATDNSLPLSFGTQSSGLASSFVGQYDEIRLRGGTLSADRIKADYDMIANRDFCT